ncbi:carbon-nitrogen hydrolase family protein [Pedobacter sp. WC2423]|uniref:carbon-nitrogen hydrolase family protein n=1 Tax=Pedobacter sp. WC2423 TaxID=3234142 RepID=UPI003466A9C5
MKIALASPPFPKNLSEGLQTLEKMAIEAADMNAEIICFPESYLPGYPGMGYSKADQTSANLERALNEVCRIAAENSIAIIVPMDWYMNKQLVNLAYVVSEKGEILGYQTKNQLDPSEDTIWVPGTHRFIFEIKDVKFGITICHEGFRYPESVRWAAQNGARIVFHPHFSGSNTNGVKLTEWGNKSNPYYEKAMMMRALENTIYFASVNYSSLYPESASSLIDPSGNCVLHEVYGRSGIIVGEIDPDQATGLLAKRFKNALYS